MIDRERLILLGEIGAAHGIKGEVSLRTFTADPADIAAYGPLVDPAKGRTFTIDRVRITAKNVIAKFKGIDDRTAVEGLRNVKLYIPRGRLPDPEPGSYYHEDLIGLSGVTDTGQAVGRITAVVNYGAGDLLEFSQPGVRETLLVPFTDACVPEIDFDSGRVTINLPAYAEDDRDAEDAGEFNDED